VRDLVKQAITDAGGRMTALQQKITNSAGTQSP
jgi:hypothetical protein